MVNSLSSSPDIITPLRDNLSDCSWLQDPLLHPLFAAFADKGGELRFVGGAVRDSLIGRPVFDIDAATPLLPEEVIALLDQAGIRHIAPGLAHGTVTALLSADGGKARPLEITTLRRDTACDGRHAAVTFTDRWDEDAQRRDFTFNALYADAAGQVYDYTGGLADLAACRVRFIGDAGMRIREDGLRMLRYFRFLSTHAASEADPIALAACAENLELLQRLSGERIQHEMFKLLAADNPLPALDGMQQIGLLQRLLNRNTDLATCAWLQHYQPLWDTFPAHNLGLVRLALLCLSDPALMHFNQHAEAAQQLREHWRLSLKDVHVMISNMFNGQACYYDFSASVNENDIKRDLYYHSRNELLGIMLREGAIRRTPLADFTHVWQLANRLETPVLPVTAADLIAHGIPQGPQIGISLRSMKHLWDDFDFALSREELLEEFDQLAAKLPAIRFGDR